MKKQRFKKFVQSVEGFIGRIFEDHVGAYAAQAAYFLILSFIPFTLFLLTLVQYTSLSQQFVMETLIELCPPDFQSLFENIVYEVYNKSSAVLPITAVLALWSSGKGLQAITTGLNTIYHVKESRNWLMTRIWSIFYTLILVLALIASMLLNIFGSNIQEAVQEYSPFFGEVLHEILHAKNVPSFLVLTVLFLFLYKVLPNRKASFKSQLPGAVLTALAWLVFSYCFSLYFDYFPSFTNMYGSLTAIIMIMLWMYICMSIVLYGAELNACYEDSFRRGVAFLRGKLKGAAAVLFGRSKREKEDEK
ncbi:MAG: YihY/virulence factor BrkB family protein [Lachnospiraceae bacterium]